MILSSERDPRLIAIRRGGTLTDEHHHLLARWAADCAEHALPLFTAACPGDARPADAIAAARAWADANMAMMEARAVGGHAMGAARPLTGAPRFAAYAAGQAACVGHVAEHDLGAAAYAIKAAMAASCEPESAREAECAWQRARLPETVRDLVLDDQRRRNGLCWNVFTF